MIEMNPLCFHPYTQRLMIHKLVCWPIFDLVGVMFKPQDLVLILCWLASLSGKDAEMS